VQQSLEFANKTNVTQRSSQGIDGLLTSISIGAARALAANNVARSILQLKLLGAIVVEIGIAVGHIATDVVGDAHGKIIAIHKGD